MKKEISEKIKSFYTNYKNKKIFQKVIIILSIVTIFFTMYFLTLPGITINEEKYYNFYLKDNYVYNWKENLNTEFNLKIYYMDTFGNYIEGKDLSLFVGDSNLPDDPYGFGYVPVNGESTRGKDLIKEYNLKEYALDTGEKYVFDHAEVYVNGIWQKFSEDSNHWDIWCQSSSSMEATENYGWRGKYGDNVSYTITNDTEYKLVFKLVRLGEESKVASLGADSGISFKMFNYSGDNEENGVNANGLFGYFNFRGLSTGVAGIVNADTDADGFTENRAKVLPNLVNGYPVFNCGGNCTNASLGYLFGASTNPLGTKPLGVEEYTPVNTLLQKETIDGVEYYYYDSNKNAVDYDTDNNKFILRDYVERGFSMSKYPDETDRYEFLPFNYWTKDGLKTDATTNFTYNYEELDIDHWFGMTMEFSFYMPKDGIINNSDMVFSFSGDDDVWVFVDDVLVLDLGGTHGAVDGQINFKTGEVTSYLNWNGTKGTKTLTNIYEQFTLADLEETVEWNEDSTTFDDYTLHTVKFFYLERGASVSNCTIRFNIPVLPSGSASVQKKYEGIDEYNEDYEFMLYDVTNGSKTKVSNTLYTVGENEFYTDDEGKFSLKTNEVAIFKLTNYHKYYVEEIYAGEYSQSSKCTLNDNECEVSNISSEFSIEPDSSHKVIFTNKIKSYNLTINKEAYSDILNEEFKFKLEFKNKNNEYIKVGEVTSTNDYEITDDGIINFDLKDKESITISNIPINTNVYLEELTTDGYTVVIKSEEILLSNNELYEFNMDADKNITVHNTPGITLPETGGITKELYILFGLSIICILIKIKYKRIGNIN